MAVCRLRPDATHPIGLYSRPMARFTRLRSLFVFLACTLLWQALVPGGVLARVADSTGPLGGLGLSDICFGDAHRASNGLTASGATTVQGDESAPAHAGHAGHCALCGVSAAPSTPSGDPALTHVQAPGGTLVARAEPATPPSSADWRTPESRGPPVSIH
jgi:hypothetical protein